MLGPLHYKIREKKAALFEPNEIELPELDLEIKLSNKISSVLVIETPMIVIPKKPEMNAETKH